MSARTRPQGATPETTAASVPSPASLAALCALAALATLWALVLWAELAHVRAGGAAICPLGGGADCVAVWDSPFALAVHRVTGLPVAGWGLAWGLAALALPLLALLRAAEGRPSGALLSAVRLTAGAGVVSVFVLLAVSAALRAFCTGCALTYLVVAGYAGIALFGWQRVGLPEAPRGAVMAALAAAGSVVVLLYPGLQTPRHPAEAGQAAVTAHGAGNADLEAFIASLAPQLRQTLADALAVYRRSPAFEPPAPRAVRGPADAAVRITEFSDVLCSHCAQLHESLEALRKQVPAGSFSVDSRQFPLDGECNSLMQRRGGPDSVRCLGAKVRICLQDHPGAHELAGTLFREQRGLTTEKIFALAAPYLARERLETCVASPETARTLEEDVAAAGRYSPEGTPLVLVNGRKAVSFAPFLYAMVLTRGRADDPAFSTLPPPNPRAHLH